MLMSLMLLVSKTKWVMKMEWVMLHLLFQKTLHNNLLMYCQQQLVVKKAATRLLRMSARSRRFQSDMK